MELFNILVNILVLATVAGLIIHGLGIIVLLLFRFRKIPSLAPNHLPGVSLIKPCFGKQDNEEENFDTFFNQDYAGEIQIVFVVSQETDPVVEVIKKYIARYPHVDAQLVISKTRKAYWQKVDALYDAHQVIKHEMIIWSDSDTYVKKNYFQQMVACLSDPEIDFITSPQYDARENNFATALKALGNNCDSGVYMLLYDLVNRKKKIAWGHSMGFKRSVFKEFENEAWQTLNSSFADDLVMPRLFVKYDKKVAFRNIYCPVQYSNKSLKQMISQQERFAMCQKAVVGKWSFFFGMLLFPMIPSTFLMILSPENPYSLPLLATTLSTRIFYSLLFEGLILGDCRPTLRYFWTIPIWDLMRIYFITYSFLHSEVEYHGKTFRFVGNLKLEEIKKNPNPADSHTEWVQQKRDQASVRSPS